MHNNRFWFLSNRQTGVQISSRPWQPKCHLGDLKKRRKIAQLAIKKSTTRGMIKISTQGNIYQSGKRVDLGWSMWTIVRPSCFSPKADVAHGFKTKKKKEYKDDFFKKQYWFSCHATRLNTFLYTWDRKKHSRSCRLCDANILFAMI